MAKEGTLLKRLSTWLDGPTEGPPPEVSFVKLLNREAEPKPEKRASPREQIQISAEIVDCLNVRLGTVAVENLSKHGIYFVSDSRFVPGTTVEILLSLPMGTEGDGRRVRCLARIIRSKKDSNGRYGVAAQITRRLR
jgi:hypothetical protein